MRIRIATAAVLLLGLATCTTSLQSEAQPYVDAELAQLTATDLTRLIKQRKITAEKLVSAVIANAKKYQSLNAYITLDEVGALSRARQIDQRIEEGDVHGRLLGIPVAVKDNIEVAGLPNTAGTPGLINFIPSQNAPVVQSLIDEGAIIIGKTNMHELAFGTTSNNKYFGAVGNPYKPDYYAGGSSGGTAAAVAGRMTSVGLGTDTGGSVRIPAALTGIYGYRPSRNRYSQEGITPISRTRDTAGPMARSVSDLILLDAVIAGIEPDYAGMEPTEIRLGVPRTHYYENLDVEIRGVIEVALENIKKTGVELIEVDLPGVSEFQDRAATPLTLYETRQDLSAYLQTRTHGVVSIQKLSDSIASADVKRIFETFVLGGKNLTTEGYNRALKVEIPRIEKIYQNYFVSNGLDAMIFPTVVTTARPIQGSEETIMLNGNRVPTFSTSIRNTTPTTLGGIPAISLPIGLSGRGLPIGIEIDGPYNSDQRLLRIALTLEKILGRLPPPN